MMNDKVNKLAIDNDQIEFKSLINRVIEQAKGLGASHVAAEVSDSKGLSVSVRCGSIETVEQNRDQSLDLTVYIGQSRGSASTSDFSDAAILDTIRAAYHIAKHTAQDEFAGLPDPESLALGELPELQLYHPWAISAAEAETLALEIEDAAFKFDKRITNSDGAAVSTHEGRFVMGNSLGFLNGYRYSRHSLSVAPIAGKGNQMQRDGWYSSQRDFSQLQQAQALGAYAAERAVSRLNAKRLKTTQLPVLFDPSLAAGLLGTLTQAISGGALYRGATFLPNSIGLAAFPDHIDVFEDPFIPAGMGSSAFDDEGVMTQARYIVESGVIQGYLLSSYTARKLGMKTTGNAGGSHNLHLRSKLTQANHDFKHMLKTMGTGLLVTELIGQGINYMTGDYSRGAFGYYVENGEILYPVQEITIAGNLKDMYQKIVAVGADEQIRGNKRIGSVLIESMAIAGH